PSVPFFRFGHYGASSRKVSRDHLLVAQAVNSLRAGPPSRKRKGIRKPPVHVSAGTTTMGSCNGELHLPPTRTVFRDCLPPDLPPCPVADVVLGDADPV